MTFLDGYRFALGFWSGSMISALVWSGIILGIVIFFGWLADNFSRER